MKTTELTTTQIDIDTTTEDSTRRSLIDAAADRATEALNAMPDSLITGCAYALLTSFFSLEFVLQLTEDYDDPQDVTALRHETLRQVLHLAGIEFDCKMTPRRRAAGTSLLQADTTIYLAPLRDLATSNS